MTDNRNKQFDLDPMKEGKDGQAPFLEGIYIIRHPLLILYRPKLKLRLNKKRSKVKGRLIWFHRSRKLKQIVYNNRRIVFQFNIDIVLVDMVIDFYKNDAFEGFFDFPLGHFRFTGHFLSPDHGEKL